MYHCVQLKTNNFARSSIGIISDPGVVVNTYTPSTHEIEVDVLKVQIHPRLLTDSLQKKEKKTNKNASVLPMPKIPAFCVAEGRGLPSPCDLAI